MNYIKSQRISYSPSSVKGRSGPTVIPRTDASRALHKDRLDSEHHARTQLETLVVYVMQNL